MEETIEGGQRFCRAKHFLCKLQKFHSFSNLAQRRVFSAIPKVLGSREILCKHDIEACSIGTFFPACPYSVDLIDLALADEDASSILTDDANRAIHGNVACNVIDDTWWPDLQLKQVAPPGGQMCN